MTFTFFGSHRDSYAYRWAVAVALVGLTAVAGVLGGTASENAVAAPAQVPAVPVVLLSSSLPAPGQEVTVTVDGLLPNTTFTLVNNSKRSPSPDCPDCVSTSSLKTELNVARSSAGGHLSTSFVVPLDWRGHYRIDLEAFSNGMSSSAAESAWMAVAPVAGAPLMRISTVYRYLRDKVTVTLTGLRPHTRYAVLNRTWRVAGQDTTATNSDAKVLASGVSDKHGKLKLTFRVPTTLRPAFHLLYVVKTYGNVAVSNAQTWLEVSRPGRLKKA